MMRSRQLIQTWLLAAVAALALCPAALAQDDAADIERLTRVLGLRPGQTVVEIGAGGGALSVAVARIVGPDGHLYSNEINPSRRADISRAVEKAALTNVTVVEGLADAANVPEGCCDAAFMRNVYHHIVEVAAMNRSLYASLKPGGRIAIIDFPPRGGGASAPPADRAAGNRHGVSAETVIDELQAAGFEIVDTERPTGRWFMVVARK
jgi:predicted methyltransferase